VLEDRALLSWSTVAPLPVAGGLDRAAVVAGTDGRIFAFGGSNATGSGTNSAGNLAEVYDPTANKWTVIANLTTGIVSAAAATAPDGRIFVIAGNNATTGTAVNNNQIYTPSSNSWSIGPMAPFSGPVSAATGKDGRIYVFQGNSSDIISVAIYDPVRNRWTMGATVTVNFTGPGPNSAATGSDGRIYIFGGTTTSGAGVGTVQAYDPVNNAWSVVASMPTGRAEGAVAADSNGSIYVLGGIGQTGGTPVPTVQIFTPSTNSWTTAQSMLAARAELGAATGANGKIYAVGGSTASTATPSSEVDLFNPATGGGGGGGGGGPVVLGGVNQVFVEAIYQALLNRTADAAGLALFTTQLNTAADTRLQVIGEIMATAEFLTDEVTALYVQFLDRAPDSASLQSDVTLLQSGTTYARLESFILGSEEYFQDHGATASGFLAGLYQDVLGRPIDAAGAAYWGQILASGGMRLDVAAGIIGSAEANALLVKTFYQQYLMRAPSPAEIQSDVLALSQGMTREQFQAVVLGSAEYTQDHGGNPDVFYVEALYRDLLGRSPDPGGLSFYAGQLGAGASRVAVANEIMASDEFRIDEIDALYEKYLKRAPDQVGLEANLQFLRAGGSALSVAAVLLGSAEFFDTQGGGTNAGFLAALYQDALGRTIDPGAAQSFGQALNDRASRSAVAGVVLTSPEYDTRQVTQDYQTFLKRPPDPTGLSSNVAALEQGLTNEQVILALVSSPEYYVASSP
jgi:N-acetylneuraminic acid mutarotase